MSEEVSIGENSKIEGEKVTLGKSIKTGKNTVIVGETICIEDNVVIGDNTIVSAKSINIGFGSEIEENCKIVMSGEDTKFSISDNCFIGHDSKIVGPIFEAGDYVIMHNHLLLNGYKPCTIGHNVWIGQNCVLNANDRLTIGNGVGIGAYSSIWTHGFFGELLEGCTIFKIAPVVIEDDVWLVGSYNIISPGVRLGRKSVVLTGSVVTRDVAPGTCVAGNPARDITDKLHPYKELSVDDKYTMMKTFIIEFVGTFEKKSVTELGNGWRIRGNKHTYEIVFLQETDDKSVEEGDSTKIIFTKKNETTKNYTKVTIFDLSTKKYTKKRTEIEVKVIKFLLPSRARFLPYPC